MATVVALRRKAQLSLPLEPPPLQLPPAPPIDRRILWQWVVLSIVLHILAILLFGAPSGGSPHGRAMWGSLDVVIKAAPRVEAPSPPATLKMERTLGGKPMGITDTPPRVIPDTPYTFPPLLDRIKAPDLKLDTLPAPKLPPPTETQAPQPAPPPQLLIPDRIKSPTIDRALVQPPALPAPLPPVANEPLIRDRFTAPLIERSLSAPPALPAPLPPTPAEPLIRDRVTAPAIDRTLAPAPSVPVPVAEPVPAPAPSVPAVSAPPPVIPDAPKSVVPDAKPAIPDAPKAVAPETSTGATIRDPILPPAAAPVRPPIAPVTPPRRDDPSSAYDPTKSDGLDIDAIRRRAAALGTGNRAPLAFPMPAPPPVKSKLEKAIENARKPDCRDAYKDLGLLAVVPLIANEFGEGTCRW